MATNSVKLTTWLLQLLQLTLLFIDSSKDKLPREKVCYLSGENRFTCRGGTRKFCVNFTVTSLTKKEQDLLVSATLGNC